MRRHTVLAAAVLLSAAATPLAAQQSLAAPTDTRVAAPSASMPTQSFTFNPIGLAAGFYSAEYEHQVGTNFTLALAGSYFDLGSASDKVSYLAGDVRARFYPRRALDGFAVGVSVGPIRTGYSSSYGTDTEDHDNGFTFGTTIEHSWLLGADNNVVFSVGGGFKRLVLINGKQPNADTFYPTLRTSFGVAF